MYKTTDTELRIGSIVKCLDSGVKVLNLILKITKKIHINIDS